MGIAESRAEVIKGLEPLTDFNVDEVRRLFKTFEDVCPTPAVWEVAFGELLGCFSSREETNKAFQLLDTDGNGLVDGRELLGALSILSQGHLEERMALLFEIFDLNKEGEMAFDEVFLMLRLSMFGLRKMVGIASPPEKIVMAMTQQIYKSSQKHKDHRVVNADWYNWWSRDASCRNALKMFVWIPEDQRGLPTPQDLHFVDYAKAAVEPEQASGWSANRANLIPGAGQGAAKQGSGDQGGTDAVGGRRPSNQRGSTQRLGIAGSLSPDRPVRQAIGDVGGDGAPGAAPLKRLTPGGR